MNEWRKYPKTTRLSKCRMRITEKLDGTNAAIEIIEKLDGPNIVLSYSRNRQLGEPKPYTTVLEDGSEKTYMSKEYEHFGFREWVKENAKRLSELLPVGIHYGEWCGPGIQKNPLGLPSKRFFLFNGYPKDTEVEKAQGIGLFEVPTLYIGKFSIEKIEEVHNDLLSNGTKVFNSIEPKSPEGIIINAFGTRFKKTELDLPKGLIDE